MVNCAMMHGLAISLPEITLLQSALRLSACAHMHIHTRMRASSDARLAAARGLGAVTAGGHSIGTAAGHIVEHLPHGELIQTRISKCGGSLDDIALTSPTRGCLSDGACVHLLCRVPSLRSSGLLVAQCQGWRFVARVGCARSGACLHGVWHVLDIHGYASQTVHGNSPSKNPGLSEASLTCRDESCIRECMQRVQVEVRVYRISEVCEPPTPVQRRSPTRSPPARGHRHSRTSVYRWSKIGRVARPRQYACNDRGGRNPKVR